MSSWPGFAAFPPHPRAGSLADVDRLAPLVMAGSGALTILETAVLFQSSEGFLLGLLAFVPPTIGTTCAAMGIVRRNGILGLVWPLAIAAGHVLIGAAFSELGLALAVGAVFWVMTFILASPMLAGVAFASNRRTHDRGDGLLGYAGFWMLVLHLGALGMDGDRGDHFPAFLPGIVIGLTTMTMAYVRGRKRRAWCRSVVRGDEQGYRVRPLAAGDPLDEIAPVYGSLARATSVIERVEHVQAGGAYRDGFVATPVALVPA